jgi:hypothetical protein
MRNTICRKYKKEKLNQQKVISRVGVSIYFITEMIFEHNSSTHMTKIRFAHTFEILCVCDVIKNRVM